MKKLLIANRGEIALRIIRACLEIGVQPVPVYTRVDANLPYLKQVDESVCISERSYIEPEQVVAAALSRGCDAVHPGYGFLAENAEFARLVEQEGLTFVGPASEHMELMGDKLNARSFMATEGIPVMPGSDGAVDVASVAQLAAEIGFPVMLKASHGGGGKGMAVVHSAAALEQSLRQAQTQSLSLFNSDSIYLEKYLDAARHIELQIAGDGKQLVRHFGARDCSIQRQHQKLIEEAPPLSISSELIESLAAKSCDVLQRLNYRGVGTLEFLYQEGEFYFIEMNTRIQVEHPVTECVTGVDLLKLQLAIARGDDDLAELRFDIVGHAIECRINAEDQDFVPVPGGVEELVLPGGPGIRVDTHLQRGYTVPHFYDSMLAKLIAHGANRTEALSRMQRALGELKIKGQVHNGALHQRILGDANFQSGEYTTRFLEL